MAETLRALIVEDSEDDCLILVDELRQQGFAPEWERVQTGPAMKEALQRQDWDVVLSDFSMPKFDGLRALQVLQESMLDIPFIVVSGIIGEDVAVKTMKAGAHDYLLKDKLTRLGEAIRREMRDAQVRAERNLGIARIKHLNRVLSAIRNINQLIVREKDPDRLIERTCELLVQTRGYHGAWILRSDLRSPPLGIAGQGWDASFEEFSSKLATGWLPPCAKRVEASKQGIATLVPSQDCEGCPLGRSYDQNSAACLKLLQDDTTHGLLVVAVPKDLRLEEVEKALLLEIAGDIAFALKHIEVERQRRAAEEALMVSEENFRKMFDESTDGILLVDQETRRFRMGNKAILEMTGYTREEIVQLGLKDIHPENDLPWVIEEFERQARQEIKLALDIPVKRKDGTVFYADVNTTSIVLDGVVHIMGVIRDMTEVKQMQAQLAQSDRLSSMGMLAAGVAHEINNPLTYILYNLESLCDDLPRFSDAMRRSLDVVVRELGDARWTELIGPDRELLNPSMLDDIRTRFEDALGGTRRIKDIARGLGTFSRVEKDQAVSVNLMHVIEVALNMAFSEIKYRARLVKDYGHIPTIMASEGRLSQVFLNLVINATHAIDEGDVDNNEIRVKTWAEDDAVCAEVRDTGSGIAPENLDKLFEPFFTTKNAGVGSGLGLAISKSIVEDYKGTIQVSSEVGKGTSFIIRFPVLQKEEAELETPSEATAAPYVQGRILIVDDEAGIRSAMARMLRDHETVQAASGTEAIAILEKDQSFDLVLCDMMMPEISGMDLHEWLAESQPQLARQLIFITGGAFTPRARDYLSKVDNIRLEKPFDMANFRKIVGDRIHMAKGTRP